MLKEHLTKFSRRITVKKMKKITVINGYTSFEKKINFEISTQNKTKIGKKFVA
jgi:hypothetical protein